MPTDIQASDIAAFLGAQLHGQDQVVNGVGTLDAPRRNSLHFMGSVELDQLIGLESTRNAVVIVREPLPRGSQITHIVAKEPRLAFARVAQHFFVAKQPRGVSQLASVAPSARLGENTAIGDFVVIEDGVTIGANTEIRHGAVVRRGSHIGADCLVKAGSIIGDDGFGFAQAEDGSHVFIPHLGGVSIGDDVVIGSLNTVVRGTIDDTSIASGVRTDDHVHIAHNVSIGSRTVVTACAEISGSVSIGCDVWIGPNASVMNGISIGDRSVVGLGAVVTRSVEPLTVVAGSPARVLKHLEASPERPNIQ